MVDANTNDQPAGRIPIWTEIIDLTSDFISQGYSVHLQAAERSAESFSFGRPFQNVRSGSGR